MRTVGGAFALRMLLVLLVELVILVLFRLRLLLLLPGLRLPLLLFLLFERLHCSCRCFRCCCGNYSFRYR